MSGAAKGFVCEFCSFQNPDRRRARCDVCGKRRTKSAPAKPAAAASKKADAAPAAPTNTVGGYAERLSEYPNKGVTGLPETEDAPRALATKLERLAELAKNAERIVFLTGAGISTSAGIPDFRGPNGIWTLEDEAKKTKRKRRRVGAVIDEATSGASFETAVPTPTHMALTALASLDKITFLATQNVRGRRGRPPTGRSGRLAEKIRHRLAGPELLRRRRDVWVPRRSTACTRAPSSRARSSACSTAASSRRSARRATASTSATGIWAASRSGPPAGRATAAARCGTRSWTGTTVCRIRSGGPRRSTSPRRIWPSRWARRSASCPRASCP
mmetsp:Transcript_13328/g.41084  ORF Transcript_13328/g.41084 Transcript_13328/m.41084 type:complete len:330 (-) Transcript_13328:139-1128(-)